MGNNQDQIDSYIKDELNKDERERFENALKFDKFLKNDFELTTLITKSLSERADLYQRMTQWESQEDLKKSDRSTSNRTIKTLFTCIGLVSSILIGVLIISSLYTLKTSKTDSPITSEIPHFKSTDFMAEDYKIYTHRIDSLINIAEYEKAMSIIVVIEKDFDSVDSSPVNELERAGIETLESQTSDKYINDAYVLRWRIINVLIALGDLQNAMDLLNKYKDEPGIFKEDALKLYETLSMSK